MVRRKRCRFCRCLFYVDPRVKDKQYACRDVDCQKQRKRSNQANWVSRHPGYFKGRYRNTRRWLDDHPGYLSEYRRQHPEAAEKHAEAERNRRRTRAQLAVDIQDAKTLQAIEAERVTSDLPRVNIQDPKSPELLIVTGLKSKLLGGDIQDSTDLSLRACYNLGRTIWNYAQSALEVSTHVFARKTAAPL